VPALLGWDDPGAAFTAVIQLGTLVAVLLYFSTDIIAMTRASWADLRDGRRWNTRGEDWVGWSLWGLSRWSSSACYSRSTSNDAAFAVCHCRAMIALAVVLGGRRVARAMAPASRSRPAGHESSRLGGCRRCRLRAVCGVDSRLIAFGPAPSPRPVPGHDPRTAARFSFLLSLPAVFAAGIFELIKARHEFAGDTGATSTISSLRRSSRSSWATPQLPSCLLPEEAHHMGVHHLPTRPGRGLAGAAGERQAEGILTYRCLFRLTCPSAEPHEKQHRPAQIFPRALQTAGQRFIHRVFTQVVKDKSGLCKRL